MGQWEEDKLKRHVLMCSVCDVDACCVVSSFQSMKMIKSNFLANAKLPPLTQRPNNKAHYQHTN